MWLWAMTGWAIHSHLTDSDYAWGSITSKHPSNIPATNIPELVFTNDHNKNPCPHRQHHNSKLKPLYKEFMLNEKQKFHPGLFQILYFSYYQHDLKQDKVTVVSHFNAAMTFILICWNNISITHFFVFVLLKSDDYTFCFYGNHPELLTFWFKGKIMKRKTVW